MTDDDQIQDALRDYADEARVDRYVLALVRFYASDSTVREAHDFAQIVLDDCRDLDDLVVLDVSTDAHDLRSEKRRWESGKYKGVQQ